MKNINSYPYGNGRISNIKGRPVPLAYIKIKKINNLSQTDSIYQVPDCTPKNQGEADPEKKMFFRCLVIKIKNKYHGRTRDNKEKKDPDRFALICHETKGTTWIVNMGKIEKAIDNRNAAVKGKTVYDNCLCYLIDYDNVESYLDFGGVRIEDDVRVTSAGATVLGPLIPKTVAAVESCCLA